MKTKFSLLELFAVVTLAAVFSFVAASFKTTIDSGAFARQKTFGEIKLERMRNK